jgi:hypothetical protein
MPYRIAGIDVHKKRLAVVVADVEVEDEYQFERRWYGSNPEQLRVLSEWLIEQQVEEVVMESTAQYWKPVWGALERFLEADVSESGRCRPDVGDTTSGASLVQSRAARAQDRFSRRRTSGEAARITGASLELRVRCRTTPMANTNPHKV